MYINNSITFEGIFEGKLKKRVILRQDELEDLLSLFEKIISDDDEGILEITRINLKTGRLTPYKRIMFLNKLSFTNQEKLKEKNSQSSQSNKEYNLDELSLYKLRWSKEKYK